MGPIQYFRNFLSSRTIPVVVKIAGLTLIVGGSLLKLKKSKKSKSKSTDSDDKMDTKVLASPETTGDDAQLDNEVESTSSPESNLDPEAKSDDEEDSNDEPKSETNSSFE